MIISRFQLQMRPGGLIKIYDSALMSSSQYKCLLTSERTTADEVLAILLHCYDSNEGVERFSLYEVCIFFIRDGLEMFSLASELL